MNDAVMMHLTTLMERAVAPVGASDVCKRTMRDELLAQLITVFDEEFARLGKVQAALERTAQRFGDPVVIVRWMNLDMSKRVTKAMNLLLLIAPLVKGM